jgi:hypothetical protein
LNYREARASGKADVEAAVCLNLPDSPSSMNASKSKPSNSPISLPEGPGNSVVGKGRCVDWLRALRHSRGNMSFGVLLATRENTETAGGKKSRPLESFSILFANTSDETGLL